MGTKRELAAAEDAGWTALWGIIEAMDPEQRERPGYFPQGWSVKDLMAHLGGWQAEAVHTFEQIRNGTFQPVLHDVDETNRSFYEANRDLPLSLVTAELWSARTLMLVEWNALPEITPEAEEWFRESGPGHYEEHLPRLREWVSELTAPMGPA